jgi:hypothetical protein
MTTTTTQDAKQRGIRTLAQGLAIDCAVAAGAAATVVLATLEGNDLLAAGAWVTLGTSVAKSVLTAAASYLARLKLPPTDPTPPRHSL